MAHDEDIRTRIEALVAEEHALHGRPDATERRRQLEQKLDQCWDLLRQREARREAGDDPTLASVRSIEHVENYVQ